MLIIDVNKWWLESKACSSQYVITVAGFWLSSPIDILTLWRNFRVVDRVQYGAWAQLQLVVDVIASSDWQSVSANVLDDAAQGLQCAGVGTTEIRLEWITVSEWASEQTVDVSFEW